MKKIITILLFSLVFVGAGCFEPVIIETEQESNNQIEISEVGLANPASVHCKEQGGVIEMHEGNNGTYGICTFEDGRACEEWAFFRGECSLDDEPGTCLNKCGDGVCQEHVACEVTGCPCTEDIGLCELDCGIELPE